MNMKVLVLGANGYVGRRLVGALAQSGWAQPVAASRRGGVPGQLVLDATDAGALTRALGQADAVINCVSGSPDTIARGAQALKAAQDAVPGGPRRLVHFSSMAVYGPATGIVHENRPVAIGLGGYAGAKVDAEQALHGDDVVMLRPGCVYGPGSPQWSVRIQRLLRARRIGDLGPAGDGCSNLVHVDDVIAAALAALRAPDAGGQAYNLAMPQAPTWNAYFVAYARLLGSVPVVRLGRRRLRLETRVLAPALKIAEILGAKAGMRGLPPPIPPSLARLWEQDIRLNSDKAQAAFDLRWMPLDAGLRSTLA